MFCEKCGHQLPDDAKFCENCGSSTEPGAPAAAVAVATPAAPAAPSAFALALKKFFSNKRNVIITLAALAVVIALIVVIIVIASQPEKIYLDDYFSVRFDGVDGSGSAYVYVTEEQQKAFEKLNKELFPGKDTDEYNLGYLVRPLIDWKEGQEGALKNGEAIKLKIDYNTEAKKLEPYLDGYKIVLRNDTVKVKGLIEEKQVNLLDCFSPVYEGYNGYGRVNNYEYVSFDLANGVTGRFQFYYGSLDVELYDKDGGYLYRFYFVVEEREGLKNGDTITYEIAFDDDDSYKLESLHQNYGIKLNGGSKTYTVSGLTEPAVFTPSEHVSFKAEGYSGVTNLDLTLPSESITLGSYSLAFSYEFVSYYSYQTLYVDIIDAEGDTLRTLQYRTENYEKLSNGDKITLETYNDIEDLVAEYGIVFPESFGLTVSGLKEAFDIDVPSRCDITFTGFSGHASFVLSIPEEDRVYKSPDGKYTVTLDLTESLFRYDIKVRISDEDDNELKLFTYRVYTGERFKNGDALEFESYEAFESSLEFVNNYGVFYEGNTSVEIKNLPESAVFNVAENLNFNFVKADNGSVNLELTARAESFKVGNATVTMTIEPKSNWFSTYHEVTLKATDENGNEYDLGWVEYDSDNLIEGNSLRPSYGIQNENETVNTLGFTVDASTSITIDVE